MREKYVHLPSPRRQDGGVSHAKPTHPDIWSQHLAAQSLHIVRHASLRIIGPWKEKPSADTNFRSPCHGEVVPQGSGENCAARVGAAVGKGLGAGIGAGVLGHSEHPWQYCQLHLVDHGLAWPIHQFSHSSGAGDGHSEQARHDENWHLRDHVAAKSVHQNSHKPFVGSEHVWHPAQCPHKHFVGQGLSCPAHQSSQIRNGGVVGVNVAMCVGASVGMGVGVAGFTVGGGGDEVVTASSMEHVASVHVATTAHDNAHP